MEIREDGSIGMIRNKELLMAALMEINETYKDMGSVPMEDKLMADLLYGANDKEKAQYIKRVGDFKKYETILEHEILTGKNSKYDLLATLEMQMRNVCCAEEDITAAKLEMLRAYMESDGEDYIRRVHEVADPRINRNKKLIVKWADSKSRPMFDYLSRQLEATPDSIKCTMLRSTSDELHAIIESAKVGTPKIDSSKLKASETLLRYNRADEEGKKRIRDELMSGIKKGIEEVQESIEV